MGVKAGKKRKHQVQSVESDEEEQLVLPPTTRTSDEPIPKKSKWINRQRVLVFAARGISNRDRHLMMDLRTLLPHCRTENKMEKKNLFVINEVCEVRHCNKVIFLEARLMRDLYMWLSNAPNGPSAKFLIENVYTMSELKMTGNCLKGTRPLLSFDKLFDEEPHYQVLKELIIQIFGTPNGHPKSQPFFDHVLTFSIHDHRIWFRNYQILGEDGALAEVGPRFVMNPIKIFDGSFTGATLWENPHFVTPAAHRRILNKHAVASKYANRVADKAHYELTRPKESYGLSDGNEIFEGDDALVKAKEILKKQSKEEEKEKKKQEKKPDKPAKKNAKKTVESLQATVKKAELKRQKLLRMRAERRQAKVAREAARLEVQ
ncbi:hypothetical protein ONE63_000389 [Megalurothrips usitatus]|uniref:Ribosome biogenesis protein BRX1 homolog n=1 Tax=Megalurothrips usitatus TaxID=439358 RepID=A0AAV7Y1B5_9NEOP|nr:hypothetical protein ONE63_000389 [Megalurothrips usitatus]